MLCSHDRSPLTEMDYEGALIRGCGACGGELVRPDALAHTVRVRQRVFDTGLRLRTDQATLIRGVPLGEEGRHLNCPCRGGRISRVNYAGDTRVLVDRCGSCSAVWLDRSGLVMARVLLERWNERASQGSAAPYRGPAVGGSPTALGSGRGHVPMVEVQPRERGAGADRGRGVARRGRTLRLRTSDAEP
jgi:Zn-finger nucleic acid-binding protein